MMVLRKCPKCGATSDDKYGFCIRCGSKFNKIHIIPPTVCPICGWDNEEGSIRCIKCNAPLSLNRPFSGIDFNHIFNPEKSEDGKNYTTLIALGYILSIFPLFWGIIGLFIAVYLSTRPNPIARKHGHIQIGILIFYFTMFIILYITGYYDVLMKNYLNLINNTKNLNKTNSSLFMKK